MIPDDIDIREFSVRNAAAHLKTCGLSLDDLPRFVRPLGPTETLAVVGSIPEGLANAESDIDLLLIGNEAPPSGSLVIHESTYLQTVERVEGAHEINIEFRTPDDLLRIGTALSESIDAITDVSAALDAGRLTVSNIQADDLRTLHRLRFAAPVSNEHVLDELSVQLRLDELPIYAATAYLLEHFTLREDAIAQLPHSSLGALRMFQLAMDMLAGAVLASRGETNPNPKWRIPLLQRAEDELGRDVVDRLIDLIFVQRGSPANIEKRMAESIGFADQLVTEIAMRYPGVASSLLQIADMLDVSRAMRLSQEFLDRVGSP